MLPPGSDPRDIRRTQAILTQYFNKDEENRFHMDSIVGGGAYGLTWKLRYMTPATRSSPTPSFQYIVLKTDRVYSLFDDVSGDEDEDEEDEEDDDYGAEQGQIPSEKKWLKILRWSKHIVNDVTPTKDPLARNFPGVRSHHMDMDNWVYLEWLENGTIERFVDRAKQQGIQLPNRLLWRFFLCLIRMCIAMGWPAKKPDEEDPQPVTEIARGSARGRLIHGDMHDQNIMFGDFVSNDPDTEHIITPILKLIDLGSMRRVEEDRDAMREAVCENLFDIGIIMAELVTLSSAIARDIYPSEDRGAMFRRRPGSQEVMTNGSVILPNENNNPYPNLDTALRGLICTCLATASEDRPSASGLANAVTTCIRDRDEEFYASQGYEGESDNDIRSIIDQLIFNA